MLYSKVISTVGKNIKKEEKWEWVGIEILNKVVSEDLSEKVTFEQRLG